MMAVDLGVRRRRRWLVRGLTWDHGPGRIAWVVGENGAGKTSLLRVLAGLARPAAGSAALVAPAASPPTRLYYHPAMRLPPELTIAGWRRFVDALLTARGRSLDVDLGPILPPDQRLGRLSTGEAKRLLLEAMLRRPAPFVLLDEPYEHLSAGARAVLTDCLIARSRDAVVVVATNQPVPVRAHGSVLRLSAGVDTHPRLEVVT